MKRPLFVILTGVVSGETLALMSGKTGMIILTLMMPVAMMFFMVNRDRQSHFRHFAIIVVLYITAGFFGSLCYYAETTATVEDGRRVCFRGRLLSVSLKEDDDNGKNIHIKVKQLHSLSSNPYIDSTVKDNPAPECISAVLTAGSGDAVFYPGDLVEIRGLLKVLPAPTNPGEFNLHTWYRSQGIDCTLKAESCRLIKRPSFSLRRTAWKLRERIRKVYQAALSENQAALLEAMVLGEKSDLKDQQKKMYSENGAAHLLAVSGLHVSILGGSLFLFLKKRGFSYGISCVLGGSLLLFYGCMTGFGSSTARAVIMYLVYLTAQFTGADYDLISAMSLSGILLLIEQPVRLLEGGFQISYVSILAIGLVLPWAKEQKKKKNKKNDLPIKADRTFIRKFSDSLKDSLFTGLVIGAVTGPVLMRIFHEWAPAGILLNLILLPCMPPLMVSAIAGGMTGALACRAGVILLQPAAGFLVLFEKLFTLAEWMKVRPLTTGCPAVWQILLLYLIEAMVFWNWLNPDKIRIFILTAVFILCCAQEHGGSVSLLVTSKDLLGFGWGNPSEGEKQLPVFRIRRYMTVDMLDVGQGESILIRTADRKTILIDGGSSSRDQVGKYVIEPALKYYGVKRLDYVVATHMDEDHISGLKELFLSAFPVKNVLVPAVGSDDPAWLSFTKLAAGAGAKVVPVSRGDALCYKHTKISCLHPTKEYQSKDRNDTSVVLGLSYNQFDMLFTGDLGEEGEKMIASSLSESRSWDVLKVAHHGSRYSTGEPFLNSFPGFKAALISAGRNNRYGHPHTELLLRLKKRKIRIYDTPGRGAVKIRTDGFGYRISGFCR